MNVNINVNSTDSAQIQTLSVQEGGANFELLLNEFLKILIDNKEISSDNIMALNLGILPFMPYIYNGQNSSQLIEALNSMNDSKTALVEIIQSDNTNQIYALLQKLKSDNVRFTLPEKKISTEILDSGKPLTKDIEPIDIRILIKNQSENTDITKSLISELSKYNSKKEDSSTILNILKDAELNSIKDKGELKNFRSEHTFANLNINSEISKTNIAEQKINLPITRLQDLSNIMFKALSASQKTLTIQLEPPEMGRILIKLFLENGAVRADMKVDYPHVKEMLTGLIPEIRSNLQSSGVKISDFLLDLSREQRGYGDSYNGQGQRRHRGNQKFFEYFA